MATHDGAFRYIDRLAETTMDAMAIPGLVIAVTDSKRLLGTSAYGVVNIATRAPVKPDTTFEIGSLGKPFTVIALMQLREAGKLALDAPVSDYLPWFHVQSDYDPITVHHLLNHTSGIVRGTDIAPHGLYESWALRYRKTSAPPGAYFSYSNIGYKTLGFLVEHLTGQSLADVIRARVLEPLGMLHTRAAITLDIRGKTATGYTSVYDDRPEHVSHALAPAIWAEYATGDGAQASTVSDMAIYLRMLLNRGLGERTRLISEESFELMTGNGVWTGGDFYGYGLASYAVDGTTYIGHGGGNAGFRSAMVIDPNAGLGVVLLANRMGETDPLVEVAQNALTAVCAAVGGGVVPPLPQPSDPTAIADAADYAGTYRCDDKILQIDAAGGKLLLRCDDGAAVPLERRRPDSFYVNHRGFELSLVDFGRQSSQVVEAFHGSDWYVNERYSGPARFEYPAAWNAYVGHYRTRSPELSNFRVAVRKDQLVLLNPWGNTEFLVPIGEALFRIGADPLSPETLRFDAVVEGRALCADYSGCAFYRTFTP